jgi:2-polyprenyl-3-methyl-5-hydroxy-6-metoxy-1,4-benzoquinol methylase
LKVLDVGCGKGELLSDIVSQTNAGELWGVDFSETRLKESAKGPRIHFQQADLRQPLPFPDGHFDVIFCTEVLEHLKNPVSTLKDIRRLLKAAGRAVFTFPNATGFAPFIYFADWIPGRWLRNQLLPYEYPGNTEQPIDTCLAYSEILALVRQGGFQIEALSGHRYFRYLQMLPISRLFYLRFFPALEHLIPALGGIRFAYNLLLRCR